MRPADLEGDHRGEVLVPWDDDVGADGDETALTLPCLCTLSLDTDLGDDLLVASDGHVGLGEPVEGIAIDRDLAEEVKMAGGRGERSQVEDGVDPPRDGREDGSSEDLDPALEAFETESRGRLRLRVRVEEVGLDHPKGETDLEMLVFVPWHVVRERRAVEEEADLGGEGRRGLCVGEVGEDEGEEEEESDQGETHGFSMVVLRRTCPSTRKDTILLTSGKYHHDQAH